MSADLIGDDACREAFNKARQQRFSVHGLDVVCEPDIFRAGYAAGRDSEIAKRDARMAELEKELQAGATAVENCELFRAEIAELRAELQRKHDTGIRVAGNLLNQMVDGPRIEPQGVVIGGLDVAKDRFEVELPADLNAPHVLEPCPFCGDTPELPSGDGTQYEIECRGCGQAMAGVQICDLMTLEERAADTFTDYRYGEEFVERAKVKAIERWNTRAPSPAGVDGLEVVLGEDTSFGRKYVALSAAQAIIDGLRVDAERYRALRHSLSGQQHCSHTEMPCISDPISPFVTYTPEGLDAAIDATLSAGKEG